MNLVPSRHRPGFSLMMLHMYWPTFFLVFHPPDGLDQLRSSVWG